MISDEKLIIAVAVISAVTFSTRVFPFLLFGQNGKAPPSVVTYLGKYFPPAILCGILLYCFAGAALPHWPFALREAAAAAVVAGLHLWKRNTMLSIFSGVAVYMLLVQVVFI